MNKKRRPYKTAGQYKKNSGTGIVFLKITRAIRGVFIDFFFAPFDLIRRTVPFIMAKELLSNLVKFDRSSCVFRE